MQNQNILENMLRSLSYSINGNILIFFRYCRRSRHPECGVMFYWAGYRNVDNKLCQSPVRSESDCLTVPTSTNSTRALHISISSWTWHSSSLVFTFLSDFYVITPKCHYVKTGCFDERDSLNHHDFFRLPVGILSLCQCYVSNIVSKWKRSFFLKKRIK